MTVLEMRKNLRDAMPGWAWEADPNHRHCWWAEKDRLRVCFDLYDDQWCSEGETLERRVDAHIAGAAQGGRP